MPVNNTPLFLYPRHGAIARNIFLRDAPTCLRIQLYTQCSSSPTIWMCAPKNRHSTLFRYSDFDESKQMLLTQDLSDRLGKTMYSYGLVQHTVMIVFNLQSSESEDDITKPGGYSTLSWVRICSPKFQPPPYI